MNNNNNNVYSFILEKLVEKKKKMSWLECWCLTIFQLYRDGQFY